MRRRFLFILFSCVCLTAACVSNNTRNRHTALEPAVSGSARVESAQVSDTASRSHARKKTISELFDEAQVMGIQTAFSEIWCNKADCDTEAPAHMKYWYHGYCKDGFPDFAALAVFESRSCPPVKNGTTSPCTSRYRVIRVLDSASDTLKKEYVDVKEAPLLPHFRHRPILIFGNYNDGTIRINGYEETREYFSPHMNMGHFSRGLTNAKETTKITGEVLEDITVPLYSFHSMGNPYYNARILDSLEKTYYYEYLLPEMKIMIEGAGKDFNELWRRLTRNRTKVKATAIKNDFAALGIVKNMRAVNDSGLEKKCMLDVEFETIVKNKTGTNSNTLCRYGNSPPVTAYKYGDCPSISAILRPQYLFGDIRHDSLIIGSLVSTQNAFAFGDTVYDISMGFPFEEFMTYFLPSDLSVGEYVLSANFKSDYIKSGIQVLPEPKALIEAAILKADSLGRDLLMRRERREVGQPSKDYLWSQNRLFGYGAVERGFKRYRCRRIP
jgi:hypothetical protein